MVDDPENQGDYNEQNDNSGGVVGNKSWRRLVVAGY